MTCEFVRAGGLSLPFFVLSDRWAGVPPLREFFSPFWNSAGNGRVQDAVTGTQPWEITKVDT
jgi:hypothetical protein